MLINKIRTLCLGFLFWSPIVVFSQELQNYNGSFSLNTIEGNAHYFFSIDKNDTIKNGSFEFQKLNIKNLLQSNDKSYRFKGSFSNNKTNGLWTFQFNNFENSSVTNINNYQYVTNVNGIQTEFVGDFNDGQLTNTWSLQKKKIKNASLDTITFSSSISFNNNIPQQTFKIKNENFELVGRTLENGLAHDVWELYAIDVIDKVESWEFNNGLLKSVSFFTDDTEKNISIHKKTENLDTIQLHDKYLDLLHFKLNFQKNSSNSNTANLLKENIELYDKLLKVVSKLNNSQNYQSFFKVTVPVFPINNEELSGLNKITENYNKASEIIKNLRQNSKFTIFLLSDNENAKSLNQSVKLIDEDVLKPISQLVKFKSKNILRYISRDNLINKLWLTSNQKSVYKKLNITHQKSDLQTILTLSDTSLKKLDDIKSAFEAEIEEQQTAALEKQIVIKYKEFNNIVKSDTTKTIFKDASLLLKQNIEQKITHFSSIKNIAQKTTYGKELINCFENYNKVAEMTSSTIPQHLEKIKKEYVNSVWNPFTATTMDEVIKKRILSAYENVLLPYFFSSFEQDFNCNDANNWLNIVNATNQRMLTIKDEDTRKIERKLKKETNPKVILDYLNIKETTQE